VFREQGAQATALRLLARREHSQRELRDKLQARGYSPGEIASALDRLAGAGVVDDRRFAETYADARMERGFGPDRIRQELIVRGVAEDISTGAVGRERSTWLGRAEAARCKRFGPNGPLDQADRARQGRFLRQRGFTLEQIRIVLDKK
jgi:regulatory protein